MSLYFGPFCNKMQCGITSWLEIVDKYFLLSLFSCFTFHCIKYIHLSRFLYCRRVRDFGPLIKNTLFMNKKKQFGELFNFSHRYYNPILHSNACCFRHAVLQPALSSQDRLLFCIILFTTNMHVVSDMLSSYPDCPLIPRSAVILQPYSPLSSHACCFRHAVLLSTLPFLHWISCFGTIHR